MIDIGRGLVAVLAAVCAGCGGGEAPFEVTSPVARPNVVWIVLDACRADHLSCYGYPRETSPTIDALAARGTVFERNYAQAPSTPQSVPNYMTGRYTAVLYQDPGDVDIWFLREPPADEKLASTIFSENEYRTAMFSASPWFTEKSRLGSSFDVFEWLPQGPETAGRSFAELNPRLFEWLGSDSEEPFFLYLHTLDTHAPHLPHNTSAAWLAPEFPSARDAQLRHWEGAPFDARDQGRLVDLYDGGVAFADGVVAEVLGELESLGLDEETIVLITSDHGELLGEDGETISHPPRESYDELLHVPLIMAGPGIPIGHRVPVPTQNADIVPTLVELAGLETDARFHGASLGPTFTPAPIAPLHEFAYARSVGLHLDTEPNRILIFEDTKFDFSPLAPDARLLPNMTRREQALAYAMPDTLTGRTRITPDSERAARATQILQQALIPLWQAKDARPKITPPMFKVNHPVPFNPEAIIDVDEAADNLWGRVPGRRASDGYRDDLLISRPTEEDSPGLILVAKVPNGVYDVHFFCTTLDDGGPPRGSSFRFLVARQEPEFRLFEIPAAEPDGVREEWVHVGRYTISEGLFRYWLEEGNPEDTTVVGSLMFVQADKENAPAGIEGLDANREQLEALGYLN